ncbi:hypothetical protein R7892_09980 [Ligilactobacillus murinus]|uniref:hypothetical protein n=1 Tax=Ligilactobacillus murinus TaxID=1622 RepID=UPI00296AD979|nr:hypothetical protein [Ligilactobacillus murinus]WOY88995.1 hypothetical protein R7892_09980 [Ligilactobacillus murinus]
MEELEGCNSSKLQNKLLFLHLSAEIGSKFTEDISQNTIKINKLRYPIIVDKFSNYKLKWNLKKRIEFAKNNDLLTDVIAVELPHLENKREGILAYDLLESSIQIRNALAHETFNVTIRRPMEVLSDEKLRYLIIDDSNFSTVEDLRDLKDIYKSALTYYFYLKEIEKLL